MPALVSMSTWFHQSRKVKTSRGNRHSRPAKHLQTTRPARRILYVMMHFLTLESVKIMFHFLTISSHSSLAASMIGVMLPGYGLCRLLQNNDVVVDIIHDVRNNTISSLLNPDRCCLPTYLHNLALSCSSCPSVRRAGPRRLPSFTMILSPPALGRGSFHLSFTSGSALPSKQSAMYLPKTGKNLKPLLGKARICQPTMIFAMSLDSGNQLTVLNHP